MPRRPKTNVDLVEWEYAGNIFHVRQDMSEAARDSACATLLAEYDQRRSKLRTPESRINVSHSKPSNKSDDSTLAVASPDRLGGRTEASQGTPGLCRVCGKPIQPTHRRGRPRLTHEECAT